MWWRRFESITRRSNHPNWKISENSCQCCRNPSQNYFVSAKDRIRQGFRIIFRSPSSEKISSWRKARQRCYQIFIILVASGNKCKVEGHDFQAIRSFKEALSMRADLPGALINEHLFTLLDNLAGLYCNEVVNEMLSLQKQWTVP